MLLAAAPAPAAAQTQTGEPRPTLTSADVAGCYRLLRASGASFDSAGFWSRPFQLLRRRAVRQYELLRGTSPIYVGRMIDPDSARSHFESLTWQTRGDSLEVELNLGFVGESMKLLKTERGFEGTWTFDRDVVDPRHPPAHVAVRLQSVSCDRPHHDNR